LRENRVLKSYERKEQMAKELKCGIWVSPKVMAVLKAFAFWLEKQTEPEVCFDPVEIASFAWPFNPRIAKVAPRTVTKVLKSLLGLERGVSFNVGELQQKLAGDYSEKKWPKVYEPKEPDFY